MASSFRAACIQLQVGTDTGANLTKCLTAVETAAAAGARLIVLPELCNNPGPFDSRESAWAVAEPADGLWARGMAAKAKAHGVYIAYDVLTRGERPYTFNLPLTRSDRPHQTCVGERHSHNLHSAKFPTSRPD